MIEIENMVDTLKLVGDICRLSILLLLQERDLCVCWCRNYLSTRHYGSDLYVLTYFRRPL